MFGRKSKKKKHQKIEDVTGQEALEAIRQLKKMRKADEEEARLIADTIRDQLQDLKHQIDLSQHEYEAVTSYLTDLQRIERMDASTRAGLNSVAKSIQVLTKEKYKYQSSDNRMEPHLYKTTERYEKEIPDALKQIYEQEQYLDLVKSDIRKIDGERAVIEYELEEAENKKEFLKTLSIGSVVLVAILFIALLVIHSLSGVSMLLPMLMTLLLAVGVVAYIVVTQTNCDRVKAESIRKLNRVTQLMNKMKIKLVNSTNTLEYSYEKYQVGSYRELAARWEQYMRAKEEERRLRRSSEQLEQENHQLIAMLQRAGLKDAELWIYQVDALLDEKEMVEVRHNLNNRRQKIREQVEYNTEQLNMCEEQLAALGL